MSTGSRGWALLGVALVGVLALAGCGSSATKTVSVSSATTPVGGEATRSSTTARTNRTSTTPFPRTSPAGATPGAQGTARSAPAPAFAQQQGSSGEGLDGAVAVVKAHGYTPSDTSDYHSGQTLRVLIGTRTGSGDGYGQQAFFFVDGRYIGTDSSQPSATLKVVSQSDTEVTLSYPLYRAHDPLCCPGGGEARVQFQLNNGRLVPLQSIPPVSSSSGLGRQ
jgi:LppP/LprE lipoprotein